jgi:uncharacterized peroxidase-related enzyme
MRMPRIPALDPSTAPERSRVLLKQVEKKLGMVPNIMKGLANSPAALQAYLGLGEALSAGALGPKLREQIALVAAQSNQCQYCLSAHTAIGQMVGLKETEISESREARSFDPRTAAILEFARLLVEQRGNVTDEELRRVRQAGVSDGEIAEVVANVAHNTLSNYFNHVAETEIDFPQVELELKQSA